MRHGAARLALRSGFAAAPPPLRSDQTSRASALPMNGILWARAGSPSTSRAVLNDNGAATGATLSPVPLLEILFDAPGRALHQYGRNQFAESHARPVSTRATQRRLLQAVAEGGSGNG